MASYEISIKTDEAKKKLDNLKADIKTTIEEIKATSLASISLDAKFKEGTIQKLKDELDSIDDLSLKIDAAITEESKKALDEEIAEISEYAKSEEVAQKLSKNRDLVENQIKSKRIPTMIFDGKKHEGLYKAS